jgi:chromosome partitioning protein
MKKIITVAHQKGGVGKTTIATNLAVELSKKYKVKVIDLDLQKSMTYFNNIRQKNGLRGLDIIHVNNAKELTQRINENNDLLIIDAGGYDSEMSRLAMFGAGVIITPVGDSCVELVGLLPLQNALQELRKNKPNIVANILLNRIHVKTKKCVELDEFISSETEFKKMNSVLKDRKDYKVSFKNGKSVIEMNNKAVKEMNNLIEEVVAL